MPGFEWPRALRRPAGKKRPRPQLLDPYDKPLSVASRPDPGRQGSAKGRAPANKGRRYPVEILTPTEVAKMLMVSPVTIRQWAQRGDLPAQLTPGGHRRFLRHEIANFAKSRGLTLQHDSSHQLRICIIDDDEQLVRFLTELLTDAENNVEVQSATNGFDAGSKIQTFRPHVVLLDLMMPEIDGFNGCCNPAKFAFLPDGRFLTSEKGLVRIKVYSPSGEFESVVAAPSVFTEDGHAPDLAVDEQGNVIALDIDKKMIRFFNPS